MIIGNLEIAIPTEPQVLKIDWDVTLSTSTEAEPLQVDRPDIAMDCVPRVPYKPGLSNWLGRIGAMDDDTRPTIIVVVHHLDGRREGGLFTWFDYYMIDINVCARATWDEFPNRYRLIADIAERRVCLNGLVRLKDINPTEVYKLWFDDY